MTGRRAEFDLTVATADDGAVLEQLPEGVVQRGAVLLLEAQAMGQLKLIGGGSPGLAQQGEQTISQ